MIPANAVWLSMVISILLNLIVLGSSAAFNALMSLQLVALMATYTMSVSCLLWARIYAPAKLPTTRWSLGRWGVPINVAAIAYSLFAFFFCFWPMATPVDLESFNWSVVMFVGVMTFSMLLFLVRGRKVYKGPVVTVEGFLAERRLEGFGPTG
jgi:choline transport protein